MSLVVGQHLDISIEDRINTIKDSSLYHELHDKLSAGRENRGIWVRSADAKGDQDYYLDISKLSSKTFYTSVITHGKTVKVPLLIKMLTGNKIDIRDKIDGLIEAYKKAVVQSRSYNLIMAKMAGLKMSAMSFVLSMIGVPIEELKKLKKQALEDATSENLALFEENIYNMELLEVLGGGKQMKAQRSILQEIETQLLTQAKRLGIDEYYTRERMLEMRVKVCKDIYFKFKEEENNLQYELDYYTNRS